MPRQKLDRHFASDGTHGDPSSPVFHQAQGTAVPGVPLVPRSGEVGRPPMPTSVAPRDERRGTGGGKAQVRSERDPPMPKPVPSIIAP